MFSRVFHRLQPAAAASSGQCLRGLGSFFEGQYSAPVERLYVGRAWDASELRNKSFDDIHKLWYVLLKERNLLATQRLECKRLRILFHHEDRERKCKLSMNRIKFVLRERQLCWQVARDKVDKLVEEKELKQLAKVLGDGKA